MLAHIGFVVKDFERSKEMYTKALVPIGISLQMEGHGYAGYGKSNNSCLWIGSQSEKHNVPATDVHVCFSAQTRAEVDEFYKAGIEAGFRDNGAPGIREMYAPNYYAAFLFDNDGNNIEVVCFEG